MTAQPVITRLVDLYDVPDLADGQTLVSESGALVAVDVATQAELNAAVATLLPIAGGASAVMPASNGTDDTTALQAILNNGGIISGKRGESYKISAPLVPPNNTVLDMRGCTVTLLPSSNCNMLHPATISTGRVVTDGTTTAASTTFTSATASFVGGDVGAGLVIAGAGPGGAPLFTTIVSRTNGTTVVMADKASTAVAGTAKTAIGPRAHDIHVIGGTWDRVANQGTNPNDNHTIIFRHVDRCSITGASFKSTDGKFAVLFQSCTSFTAERLYMLNTASDGVHVNGPCVSGVIRNIVGTCGDDMVAIVPVEFAAYVWGDEGDVKDILIDGVYAHNSIGGVVRVSGGTGVRTTGVTIRNLRGSNQKYPVWVGDDTTDSNCVGGFLDDIKIEDVDVASSQVAVAFVKLNPSNGGRFTVNGLRYALNGNSSVQGISLDSASVVDSLRVENVDFVDGVTAKGLVDCQGTINNLTLSNITGTPVSGVILVVVDTSACVIRRLTISDVAAAWQSAGGALVYAPTAGATLTEVHLSNIAVSNPSWICDLNTTTAVYLSGVSTDQGAFNIRASAVVTANVDDSCKLAGTSTVAAGGVLNWPARRSRIVTPTYASSVAPDANAGEWQTITVTNGSAFTVLVPVNPPSSSFSQRLTVEIFNNSGGAMGTTTWSGNYLFNGFTWANPANGKKRFAKFEWNGTKWICTAMSGADY